MQSLTFFRAEGTERSTPTSCRVEGGTPGPRASRPAPRTISRRAQGGLVGAIGVVLAAVVVAPHTAFAAPPDALTLLRRYDEVMSPPSFEVDAKMTAHREDGSTRSYKMRVLKSGPDKLRAAFSEPASAKGQEMLRSGENLWLYMPNLKRAVRVASRDQFMGGDFNNADVLRVNYEADYTATLGTPPSVDTVLLELKAKGPHVAYDAIKLTMTLAAPSQPLKAEFYAASGKKLRSAEFLDVKDLGGGWVRPSRVVMKNELQPARKSEMFWEKGAFKEISAQRFSLDDLGR